MSEERKDQLLEQQQAGKQEETNQPQAGETKAEPDQSTDVKASRPEETKAEQSDDAKASQPASKPTSQSADQSVDTKESQSASKPATEAPASDGDAPRQRLTPEERAARRAAAAAAKAARASAGDGSARAAGAAAAKAGAAKGAAAEGEEEKPKEPSPNQPLLDKITALIRERVGADAVEDAFINEADGHLPVVVVNNERWFRTAVLLKEELMLNYLINLSGTDYETYMEVVYHIESFETNEMYCVKVRTDRESPSVPSVTAVWNTANWQEREVYDLLGINFPGHPDLRRILMPDDWEGHPLRKDYEPLDPEV